MGPTFFLYVSNSTELSCGASIKTFFLLEKKMVIMSFSFKDQW